MPTYDLMCKDCGHKFTVFCSISARGKQICPACKSGDISQRFTAVNISGVSGGSKNCGTCSSAKSGFS